MKKKNTITIVTREAIKRWVVELPEDVVEMISTNHDGTYLVTPISITPEGDLCITVDGLCFVVSRGEWLTVQVTPVEGETDG